LLKISGIDLEGAASLACSGLTAYTAVKKAISNSPDFRDSLTASSSSSPLSETRYSFTSS